MQQENNYYVYMQHLVICGVHKMKHTLVAMIAVTILQQTEDDKVLLN